jgi:spectinomycin phosphotransferase
MLQKPDLSDAAIAIRLNEAYGLRAAEVVFLPLGADQATAVYRVVSEDGRSFFLKLRSRDFDPVGVAVPRLLHERGVRQVIPPIPILGRRLWTRLGGFMLVLYTFVEGRDGNAEMSEAQWRELGAAMHGIHAARLPRRVVERVRREAFGPAARDALRRFLARSGSEAFKDPHGAEMAGLLRGARERVTELVDRSEELADALRARALPFVLCHGDMHRGNVLLEADGTLRVIDWDTLVYAPREHDFEQIDGTWGGARGAALFYEGYGPVDVDVTALAYYRDRRFVEDLFVICDLLLDSREGGRDREYELELARRVLAPGGMLDAVRELEAASAVRR